MSDEKVYHIIPFDDIEPHTEDISWSRNSIKSQCECCPHIQKEEDGVLIFHNAFDQREQIQD